MMPFAYHRATSPADAVRRLRADPDARLLAGGQSLIAAMKLGLSTPSGLVDLSAIAALREIRIDGDRLHVGAMCTHAAIAASAEVADAAPMLAALAGGIGDRQVRNRGTIGGSVANDDPAACWPAALLACDATIMTDRRAIAADDFFQGLFTTALAPDEVILALSFPRLAADRGRYVKIEQPASRFALVGVGLVRTPGTVRIAVTGLGHGVCRLPAFEAALAADFSAAAIRGLAVEPSLAAGDLHASAGYRAHLVAVTLRRIVADLGDGTGDSSR